MKLMAEQFNYILFSEELQTKIATAFLYYGRGVVQSGLRHLLSSYQSILLVTDKSIWERTAGLIEGSIKGSVNLLVLEGKVHCDQSQLDEILKEAGEKSCLLALGSGTVNDLCRLAAHKLGVPFWSLGTAPSMDGYLSANSSVIRDGIKHSFPNITPPEGVIIDLDLLGTAPPRMLRAGIGDSLAKITSLFDWRLDTLENPELFEPPLYDLLQEGLGRLITVLAEHDGHALQAVTEFLLLSSAVMQVHRSSQPASGGEHLVSHIWEMLAQKGKISHTGFHGELAGLAFYKIIQHYCRYLENPEAVKKEPQSLQRLLIEDRFKEWKEWVIQPDISILENKIDRLAGNGFPYSAMKKAADVLKERLEAVKTIYRTYSLPKNPADLNIPDKAVQFAFFHGGEIRSRCTCMDWINFSSV
jgi:glycerol-1-phosphate dehydrogenase [NAD(P)+]